MIKNNITQTGNLFATFGCYLKDIEIFLENNESGILENKKDDMDKAYRLGENIVND